VVLGTPLPDVLVSSIAERRIGGKLAVAKLVVAGLRDIEGHGAAPGDDPLALTVAHRVQLAVAARAPVVRLAAIQEEVRWEDTCVRWHGRGSVAALLIGARLCEIDHVLVGEVGHIVHSFDLALGFSRLENDGLVEHDVAVVGDKFAAGGTKVEEA